MKYKLIIIGCIIMILIISLINLMPNNNNNHNNEVIKGELIQLSATNISLDIGQSLFITATVIPENATNKKLTWTSTNPNIAIVNNGLITGINEGNCTIYVETEDKNISKFISVSVNPINIDINKIIVNNKDIELFIDDTYKIDYKIEPNNATDQTIAFNVDDRDIVSIDDNHVITALREGNTFITLVSMSGIRERINITVKKRIIDVTNIILNQSQISLDIGQTTKLTATVLPLDATDKTIVWKSLNENIATINNNGEVLAVNSGSTVITATTNNGKIALCNVNIIVKETYELPIMDSSNFSRYNSIVSCHSDSLKYNIIHYNGNDLAFIWVKNPSKQLNNALATSNGGGRASADNILQNEINRYGYQNKCLVAANASFFNTSNGSVLAKIIISKGNVVRNNGYASVIGITNDGYLNEYINKPLSTLQSNGVTATFGHSHRVYPKNNNVNDKTNRTIVCQINKNNFVLISGSGDPSKLVYDASTIAKVRACFNLDGGGSRKLYYKTQTSNIIKKFGGTRAIPDMIYFVEE